MIFFEIAQGGRDAVEVLEITSLACPPRRERCSWWQVDWRQQSHGTRWPL